MFRIYFTCFNTFESWFFITIGACANKSILRKGYTYVITGKYPSASTSAYIKIVFIIKQKKINIKNSLFF